MWTIAVCAAAYVMLLVVTIAVGRAAARTPVVVEPPDVGQPLNRWASRASRSSHSPPTWVIQPTASDSGSGVTR